MPSENRYGLSEYANTQDICVAAVGHGPLFGGVRLLSFRTVDAACRPIQASELGIW